MERLVLALPLADAAKDFPATEGGIRILADQIPQQDVGLFAETLRGRQQPGRKERGFRDFPARHQAVEERHE